LNIIDLPPNAIARAFTCPADGSYVGFLDERLGRWRYFEILGKGSAMEPINRAHLVNGERYIRLSPRELELNEDQFITFAAL